MLRRGGGLLALTAGLALVCVVAVELILRAFPTLMPVQWQLRHIEAQAARAQAAEAAEGTGFFTTPDKELGYVNQVTPETDRYGFPNPEPWPERVSIVFLGDSLLGGATSFPRLIARALPREPVLNLSMAAAGLERQLRIYRRFGSQLRPDLVVAALFLAADFDNDAAFREWLRDPGATEWGEFRSHFAERQRGDEPYIDWQTALRTLQFRRLLIKSRLYTRVRHLVRNIGNPYPDRYFFPDGHEMFLDEFTVRFAAAVATKSDPRIDLLMTAARQLREVVAQQGAELVVLFIPSKEELFGVPASVAEGNVVARTRQRLEEANFTVLDLYRAVREGGRLRAPFLPHDMHPTELGDRLMADAFLEWFETHRVTKQQ